MKIRNMKQVGERVKEIKMKRLFRRNQIIITTLAVMIAAAGYLNYAGKRDLEAGGQVADMGSLELSDEDLMAENLAAQSETVQDILSLDNDGYFFVQTNFHVSLIAFSSSSIFVDMNRSLVDRKSVV